MSEKFLDANGISFADYRHFLPLRTFHFPKMHCVKNAELLRELHELWDCCQVCGRKADSTTRLELHHIVGAAGRSDERTNLIMLCSEGPDQGCHAEAHGGKLSLGNILWAKWYADRSNVDWVRLAVLRGSFLPDLIVKAEEE